MSLPTSSSCQNPKMAKVEWVVIEGIGRIALPFVLFAVYCGIVMDYYHRKGLRPRAAPRAA